DRALLLLERIPAPEPLRLGGDPGVRRDQPELASALRALLAQRLPAGVEAALVARREVRRRLHGDVDRLEREVGEEGTGLVRVLAEILDQAVDEQLGGVERRRHLRRLAVLEPG